MTASPQTAKGHFIIYFVVRWQITVAPHDLTIWLTQISFYVFMFTFLPPCGNLQQTHSLLCLLCYRLVLFLLSGLRFPTMSRQDIFRSVHTKKKPDVRTTSHRFLLDINFSGELGGSGYNSAKHWDQWLHLQATPLTCAHTHTHTHTYIHTHSWSFGQ